MWGFFWTDCIHESAPALQSLHLSKRGALRAMISAQYARWESDRDNAPPSMCRLPRRYVRDYRCFRSMERFVVCPIEVSP